MSGCHSLRHAIGCFFVSSGSQPGKSGIWHMDLPAKLLINFSTKSTSKKVPLRQRLIYRKHQLWKKITLKCVVIFHFLYCNIPSLIFRFSRICPAHTLIHSLKPKEKRVYPSKNGWAKFEEKINPFLFRELSGLMFKWGLFPRNSLFCSVGI